MWNISWSSKIHFLSNVYSVIFLHGYILCEHIISKYWGKIIHKKLHRRNISHDVCWPSEEVFDQYGKRLYCFDCLGFWSNHELFSWLPLDSNHWLRSASSFKNNDDIEWCSTFSYAYSLKKRGWSQACSKMLLCKINAWNCWLC
jgi:hypothetical protein